MNAKRPVLDIKPYGSPSVKFSKDDFIKVAKGALIAALGGLATWVANESTDLDLTTTQGIILAAVAMVVLNFARKFLGDTQDVTRGDR